MNKLNDPIVFLIQHCIELKSEKIPPDVINKMQELFQDTLACILAGSSSDGIQQLFDTLQVWGANEQASVLGFSEKTSVPFAALINSKVFSQNVCIAQPREPFD